MKTWLKILATIIVLIILYLVISFALGIIHPFIGYNEKFQYSITKNILCKLQANSRVRHHCEIPCSEFKNLEGRVKASCFVCEGQYPEEICQTMSYGEEDCRPSYMKWYKYSMCIPPKLA